MAKHLLQRGTIEQAASLADEVAHDETLPDELRDRAYSVFFTLSEVLCYQEPDHREVRLVPVSFGVPQYYSKLIVELELELGPEAVIANIGRFALARHCAKLVDDALYSIDFRLQCHQVLGEVIAGIRREADDEGAEPEPALKED